MKELAHEGVLVAPERSLSYLACAESVNHGGAIRPIPIRWSQNLGCDAQCMRIRDISRVILSTTALWIVQEAYGHADIFVHFFNMDEGF